ncbi:phosphoglycolate phosphatase [Acidiferrobacter sp.]|uniref:phosphoglycolate phosphatase n=1 Tax=Acidiferrobacter sp. TaxID=1872107 RepID=UPI002628F97A|nr:phosphoglycolate phosphatase [Acidiferrobacter sp.]
MTIFPLAGLLFDLDGTLVDTAPDLADAANHMLTRLGRPVRDEAAVCGWIGDGVPRLIKRALTGERFAEPDPALFEEAQSLYNTYYEAHVADRSRLYPGVAQTLADLRADGFRMACVTNKAGRFAKPLLRALNIASYFDLILCGDELPRVKPDPLPLVTACERLGVVRHGAALVGDSGNDMRAAKAAGMPALAVAYGYHHGVDLTALGAAAVTPTFADVRHFFRFEGRFLCAKALP